jgi:hypothetical protein
MFDPSRVVQHLVAHQCSKVLCNIVPHFISLESSRLACNDSISDVGDVMTNLVEGHSQVLAKYMR